MNFLNRFEYRKHLLKDHFNENSNIAQAFDRHFSCSYCEFISEFRSIIEEHIIKSHQTCEECNISFSTKDLFQEHKIQRHSYECNICTEHFNSEIDMDIHLKLHHTINNISPSDLKLDIPSQEQEETTTILENSDNHLLKLNPNVSQDIQDMKLINMINEVNENQIEFSVIDPSETNYGNVNDLFEKLDVNNVDKSIDTLSEMQENVTSDLIISTINFSENEETKTNEENETNIQIEELEDGKFLLFSENLDSEKLKEYIENSGIKLEIQEINGEKQISLVTSEMTNDSDLKTFLVENNIEDESLPLITEENVSSKIKKRFFVCSNCNLKTTSEIHMKRHLKTHLALENKMYECKICEKVFTTHSNLKRHIKNHENCPGKVSCNVCSKELTDKLHLKHHIDKHHPEFYSCNYCHKTFSNKRGCKLHELLHESKASFPCPSCDLVFKTVGRLKNHKESVHKSGSQNSINNYICPYCDRIVATLNNLKRHLRIHEKDPSTFICSICKEIFNDRSLFRQHLEKNHPNSYACSICDLIFGTQELCLDHELKHIDQNIIKCEECELTFPNYQQMIKHKNLIHRDSKCKYCNKVIEDKIKLYDHEKRHEKYKEGFKCEFCSKEFGTPSGLKYHMSVHTGKYNVYCEICGRGFHSEITLEEHRATHTKEIRYMCELCGRKFSSNSTYRMHRLWHDNPLPYTCNICNKKFKHTSILAVHKRRAHTGERPYKCEYCSQTFSVSSTLNKHKILHTRQYPFNCQVCKKGFTTRMKMAKHMAKAHNDHTLMNSQRKRCEYKMVLKPSEISNTNYETLNNDSTIKQVSVLEPQAIQEENVTILESAFSVTMGEEVENQVAVQTIDSVVSDYIIFE